MAPENEPQESSQTRNALAQDVLEYEKMVQQSASSGQLLTAIEVARDGLARFGGGKTLQQQLALALAQTGALDAARQVLADVLKGSAKDEETLCLLGRVYKEMWRHASVPAEAKEAIEQACKYYGEAFALYESYYPGINLAFTLAAAGERSKAEQSAKKVAKHCRAELAKATGSGGGWLGKLMGSEPEKPTGPIDGWLVATLAEALTHVGDTKDAAQYYRQAADIFKGRWRDLASMRRQAREILRFNGQPHAWLDACFSFPAVVAFSGHMMDAAGRSVPRFTPEMEPAVREEIQAYLKKVNVGFGYSSAACGGDLIFCECLLEMEAKVNLVLPCPVNVFRKQSVVIGGADWERRFNDVLARATTTLVANSTGVGSTHDDGANSLGLVYANRILTGLAALQAQALDLELKPVALWDGLPAGHNGGTSSVVREWESRGFNPHIVRLTTPLAAATPAAPVAVVEPPPPAKAGPSLPQEIKTLVFAEVVNFRKVAEHQLPAFVYTVRAEVARIVAALPSAPVTAETSGGFMYFVFDSLADAARLALDLRDMMGRGNWAERGLPADLSGRVALHAGPVFAFPDPVTQRTACLGAHLIRAQHILPTVTPGQVYVSQEYAALSGAEKLSGVTFEFLGRLPTTRMFEDAPLYRLERGK
jgi:tetratricopeptide (TPR) repeat protein